MATTTINARVQLRRASEATYGSHPTFIPMQGEVCFVDMPNGELKVKVGDGSTQFSSLQYQFTPVVVGYFYNGDFYYDINHTAMAGRRINTVYIEKQQKIIYFYDSEGNTYVDISTVVSDATPEQKGIMKLYPNTGNNTDGTMTQKSITDNIKMSVNNELLVFNQPVELI